MEISDTPEGAALIAIKWIARGDMTTEKLRSDLPPEIVRIIDEVYSLRKRMVRAEKTLEHSYGTPWALKAPTECTADCRHSFNLTLPRE